MPIAGTQLVEDRDLPAYDSICDDLSKLNVSSTLSQQPTTYFPLSPSGTGTTVNQNESRGRRAPSIPLNYLIRVLQESTLNPGSENSNCECHWLRVVSKPFFSHRILIDITMNADNFLVPMYKQNRINITLQHYVSFECRILQKRKYRSQRGFCAVSCLPGSSAQAALQVSWRGSSFKPYSVPDRAQRLGQEL